MDRDRLYASVDIWIELVFNKHSISAQVGFSSHVHELSRTLRYDSLACHIMLYVCGAIEGCACIVTPQYACSQSRAHVYVCMCVCVCVTDVCVAIVYVNVYSVLFHAASIQRRDQVVKMAHDPSTSTCVTSSREALARSFNHFMTRMKRRSCAARLRPKTRLRMSRRLRRSMDSTCVSSVRVHTITHPSFCDPLNQLFDEDLLRETIDCVISCMNYVRSEPHHMYTQS